MPPTFSRRTFAKTAIGAGLLPGLAVNTETAQSQSSANPQKLVFLFQGDSITDGNRGRSTDPNHIMGHGYAFSVASRIGADFPDAGFTFYNRGISGNKVVDLQNRWQKDALDLKPDVLSLLVGINDVFALLNEPAEAISVEKFESVYRDLLEQSRRQNPAILLVLGIPFVYAVGKRGENWEVWRDETAKRQAVVRKLAAEFRAVVVDYPAVFDKVIAKPSAAYWIWDGIHPTVPAHELMARAWIHQASTRLNFLKKYR